MAKRKSQRKKAAFEFAIKCEKEAEAKKTAKQRNKPIVIKKEKRAVDASMGGGKRVVSRGITKKARKRMRQNAERTRNSQDVKMAS